MSSDARIDEPEIGGNCRKSFGLFHRHLGFEFSKRHQGRRLAHVKGGRLDSKPNIPGKDALVMLEQVTALSRRFGPGKFSSHLEMETQENYHMQVCFCSSNIKGLKYYAIRMLLFLV